MLQETYHRRASSDDVNVDMSHSGYHWSLVRLSLVGRACGTGPWIPLTRLLGARFSSLLPRARTLPLTLAICLLFVVFCALSPSFIRNYRDPLVLACVVRQRWSTLPTVCYLPHPPLSSRKVTPLFLCHSCRCCNVLYPVARRTYILVLSSLLSISLDPLLSPLNNIPFYPALSAHASR